MVTRGSARFYQTAALLLALWTFQAAVATNTSVTTYDEHLRVPRQAVTGPQLVPGPAGALNVPIPTNIAVFGGSSTVIDKCPRNKVTMEDGTCQPLLMQGNCKTDEYVLLNPETNKGYCAPRLCPPDRIFVFSSQLCHDPRELNVCPPGRELYESSYGTPVCQCPDGTYEGDDDLDDDVCEPILGQIPNCPAGQVFWFRTLDLGPECVPDPCGGLNLNRGPNDLPFLPSLINGKCFAMGSSEGVCPNNTWYGLALDSLKGVCATLEEFGYNVFDPNTLQTLISQLGPPLARSTEEPIPTSQTTTGTGVQVTAGNLIADASVHQTGVAHTQIQTISTQHVTPKPAEQINQIQKQIGVLQQQLNLLQHSLNQNMMQTSVSTLPVTIPVSSPTIQRSLPTIPVTSPEITRAKLETQFTDKISKPTVSSSNQISPPRYTSATGQFSGQISTSTALIPSPQIQTSSSWTINGQIRNQQSHLTSKPNSLSHVNRTPQTFTQASIHSQGSTPQRAITFPTQNHQQNQIHNNFQQTHQPNNIQNGPANIGQQNRFVPQNNHVQQQYNRQRQNANQNLQIQLQPLDFVQIQHNQPSQQQHQRQQQHQQQQHQLQQQQQQQQRQQQQYYQQQLQQSNSVEGPFQFGQQNPIFGHGSGQNFNPGQRTAVYGGESPFIPNDSFETPFGDSFFPHVGRKRRSIPNSTRTARRRRSPLPHSSPSNVFESRLLGCRGGAVRDINAKCRNVVLPPRIPKRTVRAAPPVPPTRSCNGAFNIMRMCVSSASAANSVNAFALG